MGVDLSKLSDDDLMALKTGDLTRVSSAGLMALKGSMSVPQSMPEPAFEREAREMAGTTPADVISAHPIVRAATTASKAFGVPYNMIADQVGLGASKIPYKELDAMQARGAKALGYGGLETAGQDVAGALASPIMGLAMKVPAAAGFLPRVAQGAGIGALAGMTAGGDDPLEQAAIGAGVGGAIPAVTGAVAKAGSIGYKALIEPWANSAAIKGRAFLEAAGDKADDIMALLRENKRIVPGSAPTAGEAAVPAGRAEFAALQRSGSKVAPTDYLARTDAQNAARLGAVRSVGQDETALKAAETARSTAANPLYARAREGTAPVDTSGVLEKVDGLLAKNPGNRELVTELKNIRSGLVDAEGALRTNPQEISSVLDGLKAAIADEKNRFIRGQLTNIKDRLTRSIPGYEQAQTVFRERSAPINQMQIGQFLEQKLTPALSEEAPQRAATYAGALRDAPATIKKATGAPRFESLSEALTPQQLQVVNAVRDDLARSARFESMATRGSQAAPNAVDVASASMEREVGGKVRLGILDRGAMIANSIIYRLEGKINAKLAAEIAAEMLNPPGVAETMRQAQLRAARMENLTKAIQGYVIRPATVAGSQAMAQEQR